MDKKNPGVVGHRRDCEGAAVVESPSSTWGVGLAERHSVPDCRVLAGQILSHKFEKGIPTLHTLSGSPCSEADFQEKRRCQGQTRQIPRERGPQNHVSGGNVWPTLTSRGHFSMVSSGPTFHRRTEPSSGPNVVHLLASRSLVHLWWSSRASSSLVSPPLWPFP